MRQDDPRIGRRIAEVNPAELPIGTVVGFADLETMNRIKHREDWWIGGLLAPATDSTLPHAYIIKSIPHVR